MSKIISLFLVLNIICPGLCILSLAHAATPVVSKTPVVTNVTGLISSGQIITISGSNMVNEDTTNWDSFFSTNPNASGFEGNSYTADGYGCANCPNDNGVGRNWLPTYDPSVKLMGGKSIKFHVEYLDTAAINITSYTNMSPSLSKSELWLRWYARWDTNSLNSSHLKMFDTMGGSFQTYLQPYPKLTGLLILDHGGLSACNPAPVKYNEQCDKSISFSKNRWYEFELHYNEGTSPYTIEVYMDGQIIMTATQNVATNWTSAMLGIINTRISTAGGYMDHWWDGFAISSTRIYPASTIEISNNPTYGSGTKVYQEPLYLSDGSVQIKLNLSGLGTGPLYLWVTNNMLQRSTPFHLVSGINAPTGLFVK